MSRPDDAARRWNGVTPSHRAPVWFRSLMGGLSAAAPAAAVRVSERLFLRPPARAVQPGEREWAAEASVDRLETSLGPVRVWRWTGEVDSGGAAAPVVLLVHGWGGRGLQLGGLGRELATRGVTAVAWDLPGHGDRAAATNLPEMAGSLAAVADAVAATHGPIGGVVAHSFGTATTLVARARHGLELPRLAVVAPSALLDRMLEDFADMTGLARPVVERMAERLAVRFGFHWAELEADAIAPRLTAPALVIHDRDDRRVPYADGVELARLLPDSRLVTTEGLGHSGPLLRDPDVLDEVGRFMAPRRPASVVGSGS
jgi:pimeloyl-ACP methyl ester carboxylesterase